MRLCILLFASLLVLPGALRAQDGVRPPCGLPPIPAYAAPAAPPNVVVWRRNGAAGEMAFAACRGLRAGTFKVVVAVAGSFRHEGGAEELLALFGRISALRGVRYWSVSDGAWRPLVDDASALGGPESRRRRGDFTAAELRPGSAIYFEQTESRLSASAIYRMRVLEFGADRVVVETENVSTVRIAFFPLAAPGETRAAHFLTRISPGVWGYYGLALSAQEPGALFGVRDASLINRAAALYRHFAGIPTDREPPLAR